MNKKLRRVVTAVNDAGRSYILSDQEFPAHDGPPGMPLNAALWETHSVPASNTGLDDPVTNRSGRIPPLSPGGTLIRFIDLPPAGGPEFDPPDFVSLGARVDSERSDNHHGMHATDTVDYAICLEGEAYAVLDEEETLLRAGDVLIQRGTFHSWKNRSDAPCRMLFVLIDAERPQNH